VVAVLLTTLRGDEHRAAGLFDSPKLHEQVRQVAEPIRAPVVTLLRDELLQVLDAQLEVLEVGQGTLSHTRSMHRTTRARD
jgi:hypothetical protein